MLKASNLVMCSVNETFLTQSVYMLWKDFAIAINPLKHVLNTVLGDCCA